MSNEPRGSDFVDLQRIIAGVAARHDLLLESRDPAMAIVTMNQLALEDAMDAINAEVRETIAAFEESIHKSEKRAGTMLAQTVRESALQMREGLQSDIQVAGLKAREIVHLVDQAHRRPALIRWSAVGLVAGAVLFAAGVWLGTILR